MQGDPGSPIEKDPHRRDYSAAEGLMLVAEEAVDPGLETAEEKHSRDRADARDAVRRYLRGEWLPHCELKLD